MYNIANASIKDSIFVAKAEIIINEQPKTPIELSLFMMRTQFTFVKVLKQHNEM